MVKRLIILGVLALSLLPMIQFFTGVFPQTELKGSFRLAGKPDLSVNSWLTGDFQQNMKWYTRDHLGFRPGMVRTYNSWIYSLYNRPRAQHIITGPKNQLYADLYIDALRGRDYIGEEAIQAKADSLVKLSRWLKSKGSHLVFLQAPGKAYFHQEDWKPDTLHATNYTALKQALKNKDILYFDAQDFLYSLKQKEDYPLFPKNGIHWSAYAQHLVFDRLREYLESETGYDLPEMNILEIETSSKPRFQDQDIEDGMNLLHDLPDAQLAYPKVSYSGGVKPKAVFIGDSFVWGPWNQGICQAYFEPLDFWYYAQDFFVYGQGPTPFPKETAMTYLPSNTFIIIVSTDAKLPSMPWGLFDRLNWTEIDSSYTFSQVKAGLNPTL